MTTKIDGTNGITFPDNSLQVTGKIPVIISQSHVAVGIPSSGTIGTNGALTLNTAFTIAYPAIYLYFPAGAVYASSPAGLYYTVMSSTTAGTVYSNTYTFGDPTIPASPTVISGTGAAYTQTINAQIALRSVSIPAMCMGLNGTLRANRLFAYNLAAGNKQLSPMIGGTVLTTSTRTTAGGVDEYTDRLSNRGVYNRQNYFALSESTTSGSTAITRTTIDTSVANTYTLSALIDTATNWIVLEGATLEVLPS